MYLFLFCFLLVFDHLLQLVIGSSILSFQLLALYSKVTAKLLYLYEESQHSHCVTQQQNAVGK